RRADTYRDLPRLWHLGPPDQRASEVAAPAMARTQSKIRDVSTWLSLGPASRYVGVDPDTLRRWADDGLLKAYVTPGRHRRFAVADLQRVVATRRPGRPALAALGATSDRLTRAYARAYRDPEAGRSVRDQFGDADREAFRAEGRRLVAVLLAYLDAEGQL